MRNLILFLLFTLSSGLRAQDKTPVYFEPAIGDMIRFYFDENYFMVDKDCEFKHIERVSKFDKTTNRFKGVFKDFDRNGRLILTGQYLQDKKEGDFKAYHPNGVLKWETTFVDNRPNGAWKYYYPDGKPMLFIHIDKSDFSINQYWDRNGQQLIKDGDGIYDIDLPITGFTEHGYTKFNRRGAVKNGRPEGNWSISLIGEGKNRTKIHLQSELYENGEFKDKRVSDDFSDVYIQENTLIFIPDSYFSRAEQLLSKNCSFDEFTGFNMFLTEKFTQFLKHFQAEGNSDYDLNLKYAVSVSKKGKPLNVKLLSDSDLFTKNQQLLFRKMVESINFFLPSYLSGEPIDDMLTLSFKINTKGSDIYVSPVQIKREKGI